MNPFHYAFKIKDIESTRQFYTEILGCQVGRFTETWIDFEFWGHQLSAHVSKHIPELDFCGHVDEDSVPIPHFGCIVESREFSAIQGRLQASNTPFIIEPKIRYKGLPSEQRIMFFCDLSGNPIEIKSFTHPDQLFK